MGLRSILRWGFSGLSVLFGLVLAPNVDRLMAAHGWDKFLTQTVDSPIARFLPDMATSPWAAFVAIAVLAFTAGLWVDSALAKTSGRTPKPLRRLGYDSLNLADDMRHVAESFQRTDVTDHFARLMSLLIRYEKFGISVPNFPQKIPMNDQLRMIAHYLTLIGRLLVEGHTNQARQAATSLTQTLPHQDFSSDRDRI